MSAAGYDVVKALGRAHREVERLKAQRDALAAAARAFEESLSEYCDGPERDRLRFLLKISGCNS